MKWDYRAKKKLHGILRQRALAVTDWADYADRIGCRRILKGPTGWMDEATKRPVASAKMVRVKGFVQIGDPFACRTHVAKTEFPTLLGRKLLLVPEELASVIVTLGEAPP